MKKIALLFATIMAISGSALGQNVPKLLWEKNVGELYTFVGDVSLYLTPKEKTVLVDGIATNFFDKLGNELFSVAAPLKSDIITKKIKIGATYDNISRAINGVAIYDEEYSLVKNVKFPFPNTVINLYEVSDGFICCTEKEIYKYSYSGDLLWQYESDKKLGSLQKSEVSYSLFKLADGGFLFLDKNGKEKSYIPEVSGDGYKEFYYTPDGGFWYVNTYNFDKYDATGLRTASIDFKKEKIKYLPSISINRGTIINTASGLIVYQYQGQEMFFTKIEANGKLTTVSKVVESFRGSSTPTLKMINENEFMFSHTDLDAKSHIGVINFQNSGQSWIKYVLNSSFIYDPNLYNNSNFYSNLFLTIEQDKINKAGNKQITEFNAYNLKGDLAWSFANDSIYNNQIIGNFIYLQLGNNIAKLRLNDGKEVWKYEALKGREYGRVITDEAENEYIYSCKNYGIGCKIDRVSKKSNKLSPFFQYPEYYYPLHSNILIDSKTETITAILAHVVKVPEYSLRKYSTRCLYDLEVKAEAIGKTEVCTGEQVKLSTPKQEGLLYQWQKDGKNIPNFKDATFDVNESGLYSVTIKDEVCQNPETSNAIKVTVKPSPEAIISTDIKGVIYEPFTVKMTANSGTNLSYQWLKNDTLITNATTNIYEAKKSGKYKVSVTKDGCLKTSEALTISIQIPLANEGEIGEETVQIYPNPNQGKFKIVLPKTLQNADIHLFDILGGERTLVHTGEQAQAYGLLQGVYFLRVNKGEKSIVNKIIIE